MSKPKDWREISIKDLGGQGAVQTGPFGAELHAHDYVTSGVPLVLIRNIGKGDVREDGLPLITQRDAQRLSNYSLEVGDIVFSRVGRVGSCFLASELQAGWIISGQLLRVRIPDEAVDKRFLLHQLLSEPIQEAINGKSVGTTRQSINTSILEQLPLWLPSPVEQRHIAAILDALDNTIRATECLITKLDQAKHGLLHDLLTCGVDECGRLRNPLSAGDEFADTALGLLPVSWTVRPVEALLADVRPAMRSGPFGSALLKSELVEEGVPMLGIDNVEIEHFIAKYSRFVSQEKYQELVRYAVRPRDVMVTIMGTVGRCCVVPDDIGLALSSKHVWTLTFDSQQYLPELICLQFNYSDWVRRHFDRDTQGGIMSAIRSETLRTTLLPVPPINEQCRIWDILQAEEARIGVARDEAAKLHLLKRGLMSDLLTGRVRVGVSA